MGNSHPFCQTRNPVCYISVELLFYADDIESGTSDKISEADGRAASYQQKSNTESETACRKLDSLMTGLKVQLSSF